MQALKAKGVGIGIGTDMTAYIQYEKLEKLGLAPYIDWIVTSEEAGAEKTFRTVFCPLCRKSGRGILLSVPLSGTAWKKDVIGAADNGFVGVWYHRSPTEEEKGILSGDHYSFGECIRGDKICFGDKIIFLIKEKTL